MQTRRCDTYLCKSSSSNKTWDNTIKKKISRIIMDAVLQNKHTEKRKLKTKSLEVTGKLRRKVTVIIYGKYCIK